jgi:chromosome segregation ATPase
LHQAEKQCTEKIAAILQQLEKIEANMKEMENKETSLQGTFKKAYAEFEANTDIFKGLQSAAAKLRVEISSKSEDVRKLLNDKKEAYVRALKSEINYKELELMILKSLLDVTVRNPNTDTSDQQSMRARLKQEERMAALLNETASKKRTLEDLQYQHRAAEEEEHKLKEELRCVFVQLNQAKNNCDEAGKKTKKIQEEVDRVKKTLIQYQIDHESKSIELVDAKDSLLELETLVISRRRKELQMERNKLSASRRSTASSSDPQSAACQVSVPLYLLYKMIFLFSCLFNVHLMCLLPHLSFFFLFLSSLKVENVCNGSVKSGVVILGSRFRPVTRPLSRKLQSLGGSEGCSLPS